MTLSVHRCLQHPCRDAARRAGSSATADTCRLPVCPYILILVDLLSDREGVELGERIHRYAGSDSVDYKRPVEDGLAVRLQGHRDAHQPR